MRPEQLTATELRVAELVASGRSNKEAAAELFVTLRAVESTPAKAYAKPGVRSCTELAARLNAANRHSGRCHTVWISAFTGQRSPDYPAGMLYLAELYLPRGASLVDVARLARAGADAAAGTGPPILFIQAIFVPLDESCFALYRAESAADVTAAGTRAGLTFNRVAAALATW